MKPKIPNGRVVFYSRHSSSRTDPIDAQFGGGSSQTQYVFGIPGRDRLISHQSDLQSFLAANSKARA